MSSPPAAASRSPSPTGNRRAFLFALSMLPVAALIALLVWGQVRSGGNPGGLLVHEQPSEVAPAERAAPDLGGMDILSGGGVRLADMRGKVVVVDFWSSWCVACRQEAEELAAVHREYGGSPVEFLGVAIWDEAGDVARHLERYGVGYPNILDAGGEIAVLYGVRGVPEKYVIAPSGNIVRKMNGLVSAERLREVIDSLLAS